MNEELKSINFDSIESILDFAIEKEQEAHDFYLYWQDKVKIDAIKEVLSEFAQEELNHKKIIAEVKSGGKFDNSNSHVMNLELADYFTESNASEDMDFQQALHVAIHREIGAQKMYQYLSGVSSDEDQQQLFQSLEKEEFKHKLKLESMYDEAYMREN